MGFGGIILHGVYAYSRVAQQLLSRLGNSSPENFREIEAKFAGVVRPGDEVRTEVWRVRELGKGWTEFWWRASVVETGKACLTDGRAVIRAEREAAARL
jgi:acyl dehydratase